MWLILWNLEWKLEMEDETVLIVERERESFNGNKKGEVNRIKIHVYLFKLLDICVIILIVIFMFQ
jgi:hypothetical protein